MLFKMKRSKFEHLTRKEYVAIWIAWPLVGRPQWIGTYLGQAWYGAEGALYRRSTFSTAVRTERRLHYREGSLILQSKNNLQMILMVMVTTPYTCMMMVILIMLDFVSFHQTTGLCQRDDAKLNVRLAAVWTVLNATKREGGRKSEVSRFRKPKAGSLGSKARC